MGLGGGGGEGLLGKSKMQLHSMLDLALLWAVLHPVHWGEDRSWGRVGQAWEGEKSCTNGGIQGQTVGLWPAILRGAPAFSHVLECTVSANTSCR